LPRWFDIVTG